MCAGGGHIEVVKWWWVNSVDETIHSWIKTMTGLDVFEQGDSILDLRVKLIEAYITFKNMGIEKEIGQDYYIPWGNAHLKFIGISNVIIESRYYRRPEIGEWIKARGFREDGPHEYLLQIMK